MQDSGHTPEWTGQTVERHMRNDKRIFTSAFKAWLVEQAGKPAASVRVLRCVTVSVTPKAIED